MAAVLHYQSEMRALMSQMSQSASRLATDANRMHTTTKILQPTTPDDLDRMSRVFARYDIQTCTYSKPKIEVLDAQSLVVPPADIGLTETRRYLDSLLIAVYQLVKSDLSLFRYWRAEQVSHTWHERRDQALNTFQGWLDVLEMSIPSDSINLRSHGVTASKSMLGLALQIKVAMIMLKTCIDCGSETTFDRHMPEFEEIVSRVEHLTRALDMRATRPLEHELTPFTMELGLIHPLFFVATKCRDWALRRRAVTELKKCGKEGVWEGPIMAVVAERIAQIEEQGLEYGSFVPERARIHDLRKGVMYDRRVVMTEMKLAVDDSWGNWVVMREAISF